MNFRNLKVGQRLAAGFGLVIALVAALAILGFVRVTGLTEEITHSNEDLYPKTVLANQIKDDLNEVTGSMRNVLLISDTAEQQKELDHIKASSDKIAAALDKLDKGTVTAAGRKNLQALLVVRQPFLKARVDFLAQVAAGNMDGARSFLLKELRPLQLAYFDALDRVMAYHTTAMNEGAARAQADARQTRMLVVVVALIALVLGSTVALLATRSITAPLNAAVHIARRVADGDLNARIDVESTDETGQMLQALKDMNDSLRQIVGQVRSGTDSIATGSAQIASGNLDLSSRTEQQASSLEETASSMEELTSTVKQNADNARQANVLAASASDVAKKGGKVVAEVVDTMVSIHDSSKKIMDIIGVIDSIAFQTNILALNAAVEAARAGEQGRGFAVVASEVRNLAQRSATAAKEIKALIDDSVDKVAVGTRLVDQAGSTMGDIVASVQRVTDIMGEITSASHEQEAGIEQINQAITEMDSVTQQNAALVEEAAAAAQALQEQAGSLAQVVSIFKLDEEGRAAPNRPAPPVRKRIAHAALA